MGVYLCGVKLNQLKKIKVGIVNYLNTRPMLYGIEDSDVMEEMELIRDYPANVAKSLLEGTIDMGLVPVAIIPRMKEYYINTDYCIGCDGEVASVCIHSEVPIDQVKRVLLDYQSRTSVNLAKVLLREYFKIQPELVQAGENYQLEIKDDTAGVVIGDRSLRQRNISKYTYDLGAAWKAHTGLPFVFAAWISNKPIDPGFIERFNEANGIGMKHIQEIVNGIDFPDYDLKKYYEENIRYNLDERKLQALDLFLSKLEPVKI